MIPLAYMNGTQGFVPDIIIFMLIVLFFYWTFDTWKLNVPVFTLLSLGMLSHACGVFGWYHISPVPVQWDHVTHFFGLLPFSMLFFNFFTQWSTSKLFSKRNVIIVMAVFLAAFGVGALIELSEFLGYLSLGHGDGALMFGFGDGIPGDTDAIREIGGGWINTGWDLIFNIAGILAGLIASFIACLARRGRLRVCS